MNAKIYYARPQVIRDTLTGLEFIKFHNEKLYMKLKAHDLVGSHQLIALYPTQGESLGGQYLLFIRLRFGVQMVKQMN